MNTPQRTRLLVYLALIFLAGVVTGLALGWGLAFHQLRRGFPRPPSMEVVVEHMQRRLQRELSLTPEQATSITPVLRTAAQELDVVHRQAMVQVDAIFARVNAGLLPHLSAEQKVKLEALAREWEKAKTSPPAPPPP